MTVPAFLAVPAFLVVPALLLVAAFFLTGAIVAAQTPTDSAMQNPMPQQQSASQPITTDNGGVSVKGNTFTESVQKWYMTTKTQISGVTKDWTSKLTSKKGDVGKKMDVSPDTMTSPQPETPVAQQDLKPKDEYLNGMQWEAEGNLNQAIQAYTKYIQVNKSKLETGIAAPAHHRLALIRWRMGDINAADTYFKTATQQAVGVNFGIIAGDYSLFLMEQENLEAAEKLLRNALSQFPDNKRLLLCLGRCSIRQGKTIEGFRYLSKSLGEEYAYRESADIFRQMGDFAGARVMEERQIKFVASQERRHGTAIQVIPPTMANMQNNPNGQNGLNGQNGPNGNYAPPIYSVATTPTIPFMPTIQTPVQTPIQTPVQNVETVKPVEAVNPAEIDKMREMLFPTSSQQ
ncbi:MAG: tetratricopeptide repeat protein [Thermoguttaceae bacterium]